MQFRLRTLLIVLAAICGVAAGRADEGRPKTDFGFDAATLPPAPLESTRIVARLYRRQIDLAELRAKAFPLEDESVSHLQEIVLRDVLNRIAENEMIVADPKDVEEFYKVVLGKRLDPGALDGDLYKNPKTSVGAMFVRGWKIDRLLYQRYGGTVIFQQGNPLEPVGALRCCRFDGQPDN